MSMRIRLEGKPVYTKPSTIEYVRIPSEIERRTYKNCNCAWEGAVAWDGIQRGKHLPRANGCQSPQKYPCKDPFFGIDMSLQNFPPLS